MAERYVVFLETPTRGRCVRIMLNGKPATTSAVVSSEECSGTYRVQTQSGSVYVGPVQTRVDAASLARTHYAAPSETTIAAVPTSTPYATVPRSNPHLPPPFAGAPKKGMPPWLILLIVFGALGAGLCFLAVVGAVIMSNDMPSSDAKQAPLPPSQTSHSTPVPDDLALSGLAFIDRHITGMVKNNTDHTYSYVQVEINLYDDEGNQVGSTLANTNNLEPGSTWKFDAYAFDEGAKRAKVKDISGW